MAHITAFLENKDKEVASMGTTYKQIHELVNQINKCGYFDRKDSQGNDEQEGKFFLEIKFLSTSKSKTKNVHFSFLSPRLLMLTIMAFALLCHDQFSN